MTLIEFARLSDAELKKAEDAELITPETTRQDIQDFRELLRMEAAEHAAEAKKAQEEQDKKIEEEVLRWRYDKTVPEELIDILEDTDDASLGIKTADGQEWACVRVNMLWTATKIKKEAPKQEKPKREGDTTDYVALRREQYKLFGIDFNIGSVTEETMSWILTGYRKAHHPDKGEQNAKLTQEAVHIVRAMFPESKRNW
jgi:TFIIF-interacting CTD phosphatase-like protein